MEGDAPHAPPDMFTRMIAVPSTRHAILNASAQETPQPMILDAEQMERDVMPVLQDGFIKMIAVNSGVFVIVIVCAVEASAQ